MSKEILKERLKTKQNGKCNISTELLGIEINLFDTPRHRRGTAVIQAAQKGD